MEPAKRLMKIENLGQTAADLLPIPYVTPTMYFFLRGQLAGIGGVSTSTRDHLSRYRGLLVVPCKTEPLPAFLGLFRGREYFCNKMLLADS